METAMLILNEDGTVDIAATFYQLKELESNWGGNPPEVETKRYWSTMHDLAECIIQEMLDTAKIRLSEINADLKYADYKLGRWIGEKDSWERWARRDSLVDVMITSADME